MFVFGHVGIGSWAGERWSGSSRLGWLAFGTLLPDLIDKPLYYGLSWATGRRGPELGLLSGTRTIGHTALLFFVLLALGALLDRRGLVAVAVGMATHLVLDELGDLAGGAPLAIHGPDGRPSTLCAIFFPLLGLEFPHYKFHSAADHLHTLGNAYVILGELVGMSLLAWRWWQSRRARTTSGRPDG